MSEEVEECPVCASTMRRQVDMMLFEGWHEIKICNMLPEAPQNPLMIAAHWRAGHAETDREALTVVAISTMRDARDAFEVAYAKFKRGSPKFGPAMTRALDIRLKGLDYLAKLHGHMKDQAGLPGQLTQNIMNVAMEADPELITRIAESVLEAPKPKIQIRLRKKEAIETTATKDDAAA